MTNAYDWSRFDVHMLAHGDRDPIYDCWATAAGMRRFFSQTFEYRGPGGEPRHATHRAETEDAYSLGFHHPAELSGRVLIAEPATRFAFTFGAMRVDIDLEDTERGVLIRLVQSDIPTDDTGRAESHLNCRSCWVYYLLNLKSVVEHGIDLRDGGFPDNPVGIHFAERKKGTSA